MIGERDIGSLIQNDWEGLMFNTKGYLVPIPKEGPGYLPTETPSERLDRYLTYFITSFAVLSVACSCAIESHLDPDCQGTISPATFRPPTPTSEPTRRPGSVDARIVSLHLELNY